MSMHPVNVAARLTVRDAGGAERVAPLLGKSSHTLTKELDPNVPSAKFGLLDAVTLVAETRDLRMLEAFAQECGCVVIPMPKAGTECSEPFVKRLGQLCNEFGDVMREAGEGAADGKFNDNELTRLQKEWLDLVAEGTSMLADAVRMNERAKPSQLRAVA